MTITIERLGHLGDGLADRGAIRVPLTLPGEVVEGTPGADGRVADARIVTPSPDRVRGPCPHYRACGGCALQHASDSFVAAWKTDVVRTALAAQGLDAPFRPVLTSPPRSRRRAVLSGRRTKAGTLVGLHARASDTIVEIPGCLLLDPALMAVVPALREVVALGASRSGELAMTVTLTDGGIDLSVAGGKPMDADLFAGLAALAERAELARLSWRGEVVVTRRPPVQRFGSARVLPPAGAFLQATRQGEAALLAAVVEAVGDARRIVDLFSGSGTFSLPLAVRVDVLAVEGEGAMTAALLAGARQTPGLHQVTAETRDLFRRPLLPDELARFDAVVIDPPRAGCEAQAREIAASGVAVVAAVSCNPVTFARDAKILCDAGFGLDWVQVVDQFRWSPHVELVARFSR